MQNAGNHQLTTFHAECHALGDGGQVCETPIASGQNLQMGVLRALPSYPSTPTLMATFSAILSPNSSPTGALNDQKWAEQRRVRPTLDKADLVFSPPLTRVDPAAYSQHPLTKISPLAQPGTLTRCSPAVLRMPTMRTASGGTGWLLNVGSRPGLGGGVS